MGSFAHVDWTLFCENVAGLRRLVIESDIGPNGLRVLDLVVRADRRDDFEAVCLR